MENLGAFRFDFNNLEFWESIGKQAPTVTSAKMSRPKELLELIKRTGNRITFMPNESTVHSAYATSPETTRSCWATAAAMNPKPIFALMDAIRRGDKTKIDSVAKAIAFANAPVDPLIKDPDVFAKFNIQIEKLRIGEAGPDNFGSDSRRIADGDSEDAACGRDQ